MFKLRGVHEVLLRGSNTLPVGLYDLNLATAEQLCRLHYSPGSITAVKARLKELCDHHYLQADSVPTKQYKSPYYYTLGPEGRKYLEAQGFELPEAWRASKEVDKHALFVQHTLELNDVLISAMHVPDVHPEYYMVSFTHERTLKRHPYTASWSEQGKPQKQTLIPDGFLDFRLQLPDGHKVKIPALLEHDRGTEHQLYFKRRIRSYLVMLKSEGYKEHFKVGALTVLFTTFVGQNRLELMREWAAAELEHTRDHEWAQCFRFATFTQPLDPCVVWFEPFWYGPYDGPPGAALEPAELASAQHIERTDGEGPELAG